MSISGGSGSLRFLKNLILSHPEHDGAVRALGSVLDRVSSALALRGDEAQSSINPRVVTLIPPAFSLSMVIDCYQAGLRHFGEIAAHELIRKAEDEDVLRHCPDIKWHFYGNIQPSVATSRLVKTANLYMIESVHDETIATVLDAAAAAEKRETLLKVMVQVASSEEEKKLGLLSPSSAHRLCRHILEDCPYLELCGLMTNSLPLSTRSNPTPHYNESTNNNDDDNNNNESSDCNMQIRVDGDDSIDDPNEAHFQALTTARLDVCRRLQMEVEEFELSMGDTWDFERAVEMGSSNIRITLDSLGFSPPVISPPPPPPPPPQPLSESLSVGDEVVLTNSGVGVGEGSGVGGKIDGGDGSGDNRDGIGEKCRIDGDGSGGSGCIHDGSGHGGRAGDGEGGGNDIKS